ncbi:MAG: endonuclease [Acholeplasmataceae bacterium]|nr:endonuclease [Acholeplasmataceae bacterium]
MKKIIIAIGMLLFAYTLASCEEKQTATLLDVLASIEIGFAEGDSASNISQDMLFPTSSPLRKDAVITWNSLNKEVIGDNGWIFPQSVDVEVTVILSVQVGYESQQRLYSLTVKGTSTGFMVTFNVGGSTQVISVLDGQNVGMPSTPFRSGYHFVGWSETQSDENLFDFNTPITQHLTLYAVWNEHTYIYFGYYDSLNDLQDAEIESALTIIVSQMKGINYGDSRYILDETDQDPNQASNVILVYNRASVSSVWDEGITWNREHVWPQHFLGVDVSNTSINLGSDLHNLKPANPSINNSRGNKPFADGSGTYGAVSGGYYPGDADKGDVARILMYMHIRWNVLDITDGDVGNLDILLRWHMDDPVDDFERNRNEIIYDHQENRNPFIDHPELAERIWGPIELSNGDTVVFTVQIPTSLSMGMIYDLDMTVLKKVYVN